MVAKVVKSADVFEVAIGGSQIALYFSGVRPEIGLVRATFNGSYPELPAWWVVNEEVAEIYYVIAGRGRIRYSDGHQASLGVATGVLIPPGEQWRVEEALHLTLVAATGPAWCADQHHHLDLDGHRLEAG